MIIDGQRELCYVVSVTDIEPIPGKDFVECACVNGWKVMVKKNEFVKGDLSIYFEIDSKVPNSHPFEFMNKYNFHVKTQKYSCSCGKFYSQGLLMHPKDFGWEVITDKNGKVCIKSDKGTFYENSPLTKILNITYYEPGDNERKGYTTRSSLDDSLKAKHRKLYNMKIVKWLLKREWGRKLLNKLFNKKKDKRGFPKFVSKTDEERVENMPWVLGDGEDYVLTEKLDGTSSTYALERKPFGRYEFYVCSRNVRQENENQKCFHDYNIYWAMANKYKIKEHLKEYLNANKSVKWVCVQGESVGNVQGNPLKLDEDDLYCFNFIDSANGRYDSREGKKIVEEWGMKWVPILGIDKTQDNMDDMKKFSHGNSVVNPKVLREGIVYRSLDGKKSFKNVDPIYLEKHNQ